MMKLENVKLMPNKENLRCRKLRIRHRIVSIEFYLHMFLDYSKTKKRKQSDSNK